MQVTGGQKGALGPLELLQVGGCESPDVSLNSHP